MALFGTPTGPTALGVERGGPRPRGERRPAMPPEQADEVILLRAAVVVPSQTRPLRPLPSLRSRLLPQCSARGRQVPCLFGSSHRPPFATNRAQKRADDVGRSRPFKPHQAPRITGAESILRVRYARPALRKFGDNETRIPRFGKFGMGMTVIPIEKTATGRHEVPAQGGGQPLIGNLCQGVCYVLCNKSFIHSATDSIAFRFPHSTRLICPNPVSALRS